MTVADVVVIVAALRTLPSTTTQAEAQLRGRTAPPADSALLSPMIAAVTGSISVVVNAGRPSRLQVPDVALRAARIRRRCGGRSPASSTSERRQSRNMNPRAATSMARLVEANMNTGAEMFAVPLPHRLGADEERGTAVW